VYSKETQAWIRAEERRLFIRRLRRGILFVALGVVSIWGYLAWRADNFTFAWSRPFAVALIAVTGPGTEFDEESDRVLFTEFLSTENDSAGSAAGITRWLERETKRHGVEGPSPPVEFTAYGPIARDVRPPLPPSEGLGFLERWRRTREFLGYFREAARAGGVRLSSHDATVFVYFYGESEAQTHEKEHSVATRRERLGVVFAPRERQQLARRAVLVAHELLHTLGATDKYAGEVSVFPDGYADPERQPLLPQDHAEIMALGIPTLPGFEVRVESLVECQVGRKTAEEIGWTRSAPGP
jgi:hypothetical protein